MVAYVRKINQLEINQPQERFIIWQIILNFAERNNVLTQNDRGFKNYHTQKNVLLNKQNIFLGAAAKKKFIIQQLVTKIAPREMN